MELIRLENIKKVYEKKNIKTNALNDIELSIKKGDLVAIIGPSGCGKSSLLNILGLIDFPSKGRYILYNKECRNLTDKERATIRNQKISFIYQHFALIKEYTVLENIILPFQVRKMKSGEKRDKALFYLDKVSITGLENKYPDELSGGQQQRVAIARALAQETDIILADEPTGNLDRKTGYEIMNILKQLNEMGKTIIIVTHDLNIASKCKRIIEINDGNIISDKINDFNLSI